MALRSARDTGRSRGRRRPSPTRSSPVAVPRQCGLGVGHANRAPGTAYAYPNRRSSEPRRLRIAITGRSAASARKARVAADPVRSTPGGRRRRRSVVGRSRQEATRYGHEATAVGAVDGSISRGRGRRRPGRFGGHAGGGHLALQPTDARRRNRGGLVHPLVEEAIFVPVVHDPRRDDQAHGDERPDRDHDRGDRVHASDRIRPRQRLDARRRAGVDRSSGRRSGRMSACGRFVVLAKRDKPGPQSGDRRPWRGGSRRRR